MQIIFFWKYSFGIYNDIISNKNKAYDGYIKKDINNRDGTFFFLVFFFLWYGSWML